MNGTDIFSGHDRRVASDKPSKCTLYKVGPHFIIQLIIIKFDWLVHLEIHSIEYFSNTNMNDFHLIKHFKESYASNEEKNTVAKTDN